MAKARKFLWSAAVLATLLVLAGGYLLFWPVPIDPASWSPPMAPAETGLYARNDALSHAKRFAQGIGQGPEDVAIDKEGRIYTGLQDGRIVRLAPDGRNPTDFANTRGRPLGLAFDRPGTLFVADALRGLLSVSPTGVVAVLTDSAGGKRLGFPDDLDVADDGQIYFSDASDRFAYGDVTSEVLEHRPHGRLLRYDPRTSETKVLLDDLYFANGVALGPEGMYVLVNETIAYRVRRYWLKGPKTGTSDVFADNLPGFPDNINFNGRDTFWVAIFTPRDPTIDSLMDKPFQRKILARLPSFVRPAAKRVAYVVALGLDGSVKRTLQDWSADAYSPITSAFEHNGVLYLGSLERDSLASLPVPTP